MYQLKEKKLDQPLSDLWKNYHEASVPETDQDDYMERIRTLWSMPQSAECQAFAIYGDREHFSNIEYFTGFDPRFEEAMLLLVRGRKPVLLAGNEGCSYAVRIPYPLEIVLYQEFSPLGEPKDDCRNLKDLFDTYLPQEGNIGLIGWRWYDKKRHAVGDLVSDVPHYIVETMAAVVGKSRIKNKTDLLIDSQYGLRHKVSAKEIVQFEMSGTKVSRGVYHCLKQLKVGVSEIEASRELMIDGSPESIHPNVNFGDEHLSLGISSPQNHRTLKLGDFIGVGYAYRGSLVHRAGIYARGEVDVPVERKHYLEKLVKPYVATVFRWYEMAKIGTPARDIYEMVDGWIGLKEYCPGPIPGHQIHTEEWSNSPFMADSNVILSSGMALQCDYTVSFADPYVACHIEDGVILADQALREEVQKLSPECWERICSRREFMKNVLGIHLSEELLPMSDLTGVCMPYMADLQTILVKDQDQNFSCSN